jgi:adenylate cyclase
MLRSLPEEDSSRLASRVLADAQVPAELRDLVIERAEGNPFYIEEVVHAVVESGALRRADDGEYVLVQDLADVRIPDTVQGVILSRLDRLSWPAKELVQHAAIIGRAFPLRLVEHVLGPDAEVPRCLDEL